MKIAHIPTITFDKEEIEALQTIAHIDCEGLDCRKDGCPFNWTPKGETPRCIKGEIKEMMIKRGVSF